VKGLNRRGVLVGLQDVTDPQLLSAVTIPQHRLGAVVLTAAHASSIAEDFLQQVETSP
jgi:hypothetical protein